jgi:hypothetical protein
MKTSQKSNRSLMMGLGLITLLATSMNAFAYDSTTDDGGHRHHRGGFFFGICVGQSLAQAGVTLPARVPGQKPTWDVATQAAFKTAVQSCKPQREGTPAPTPTPTTTPSS